jgi:hypothetical protein
MAIVPVRLVTAQCVPTVCAVPKVNVQVVADALPTVIVPAKSLESGESEGDVPQDERTGAVEEADTCPAESTANNVFIGEVEAILNKLKSPVCGWFIVIAEVVARASVMELIENIPLED